MKLKLLEQEIEELKKQHNNFELELWFFDETGFDLEPSVPYAWQPIEPIEVPSSPSQRLNVLGFLTQDNKFESFCFECSVDTDIVIATLDKFIPNKSSKKRVIILDNASIHTSYKFIDKIEQWEKQGLFIKYLPPESKKLNIIEILWRFIKYTWLPFSAYSSFKQLVTEVENILSQIGEQFKVQFAT
ncbi:MAG TPA: IS630 family transposase [Thiotrichaceae bacterium]|nr:IS630 family transposase [Thiotrichaceae bacterium]